MSAIILSGGKSLRMGENKAFIKIDGIPLIERVHSVLSNIFEEVLIISTEKRLFSHLDARLHADLMPNRGVLGGLYTGLFFSSYPYSFCVACDMPYLKKPVIQLLVGKINDEDVIVPKTRDGLQPLHGIYSKSCLSPIKSALDREQFKILDFYPLVKVKVIDESEFLALDPGRESFINVNTPEELLSLNERIEQR
jgi:molybdopterin-guanine dinucleotide biosynthesis protein A